jgi:glycosyltransferase involved in cell wall biosynthesis
LTSIAAPVRILHVHSTFTLGGKEARAVRLMNRFADAATHVVLSGVPGALAAREAIEPGVRVEFPGDHPPLTGPPSLARYHALARYMRGFDLVLTYNWGAMDAVMARRLFGGPPLVHHEDGFNADEAGGQKRARILFRRLALPAAANLVVPSEGLERIARLVWRQPAVRVRRIPNGIPMPEKPMGAPLPEFARMDGALLVATVAGLREVKNLPRLVRAFAAGAPANARLAIVGEGPEREAIVAQAEASGVSGRVTLPGFFPRPVGFLGQADLFALSSDSEQFPISLIEAMACALAVVATDVGDIRAMVAAENRPYIVPAGDEAAFAAAMGGLLADAPLRVAIGQANRVKAFQEYDESVMIRAYDRLYGGLLGRENGLIDRG